MVRYVKSHPIDDQLCRAINIDMVRPHRHDVAPRSVRVGGLQSLSDVLESEVDLPLEVCGYLSIFLPAALAGGSDRVAKDNGLGEMELCRLVFDAGIVVESRSGHGFDDVEAKCLAKDVWQI